MKNTDSAEQKGYDAGKKVSGIKRHIAVDMLGLPHAIAVTTAEVTDRAGALTAITRCAANLTQVTRVLVDGGYSGPTVCQRCQRQARRHGSSCQTQRTAYVRSHPATVDR